MVNYRGVGNLTGSGSFIVQDVFIDTYWVMMNVFSKLYCSSRIDNTNWVKFKTDKYQQ